MRLLLDTHTLLWFLDNSPHLSATARALIEDEDSEVFASIASLWEMAIKVGIGKLQLPSPYDTLVPQ